MRYATHVLTGCRAPVMARLRPGVLARLDAWRAARGAMSRSMAIERLIEQALDAPTPDAQRQAGA